jgi:hypothetical protein
MTPREGCNVAYFHIIKDMREEDRAARMVGHQFEQTLEERIQHFEEKIGLRPDHEDLALWMHKNVLLPALGKTWEDEEVKSALPKGVSEEDRWRFEDVEEDGLANFKGSPWDLPGMGQIRALTAQQEREAAAETARDTLGPG